MERIAIGADIGGSHISCAAVDLNEEKIIPGSFSYLKVDSHASADEIIKAWGRALEKSIGKIEEASLQGIGLAMPGPFDYEKGISLFTGENHKFENTYGLDIGMALRSLSGIPDRVNIRFVNDAVAFAIGEAWVGKAKTKRKTVSITLGTGLGSGFADDGLPVLSGDQIPPDGFIYILPFKNLTADDLFSTRGLVDRYFSLTGIMAKGAKEIAEDAQHNLAAKNVFSAFGEELALFLSPLLNRFNAEALIVGGSISKSFSLFAPSMQKIFNDRNPDLLVEKSDLDDLAQIFGGARLINDDFWDRINTGK